MRSNLEHLVASYVAGFQDLRDQLVTLIRVTVDDATFTELDVIGKLVGEPRDGDEDDDYRRRVKARIATNRSSGTPRQLITIARLILGDDYSLANGGRLIYENTGIAGYTIRIDGLAVPQLLADVIARFLVQATGAGIATMLVTNPAEDTTTWAFYDDGTTYDDGFIYHTGQRGPLG